MKKAVAYIGAIWILCNILQSGSSGENSFTLKQIQPGYPKYFPKPIYIFENNPISVSGFLLGRKLFYDERLSRDHTVGCHTCHQQFAAFAHIDHALSHGIDGKIGTRNVPALQNLIWKDAFMADGGINHIEIQPISPITNKIEMDGSFEKIIETLKQDPEYVTLFQKTFHDTLINSKRILKALAQFTGAMVSDHARYDSFMLGKVKFTKQENSGMVLFNKHCNTCHTAPLFTNNGYANNGLLPDTSLKDKGRGKITANVKDDYTFKIPSLRNIERTFPYMHDGRYRTLDQVMNHYAQAKNHSNANPLVRKIDTLSVTEIQDLKAFLSTLTDYVFINDPRFRQPQN